MRYKIPSSSSSRSTKLFSTLLVSGIMTCCSSDPAPNQYPFLRNTSLSPPTSFSQFRRTNWSSPATIAEREFLVYFDPSIPAESVNRIHDEISSMGAQKIGNASLLRMIQYRADPGIDMNLLLDFALRQPEVLTAQPNFAVSPLVRLSPEVTGDVSDGYWWINNIRAREAWDFIESYRLTYSPVPIALVDSGGIDPSGPLRNRSIQSFTPCLVNSNVTYSITPATPASSCFSGAFLPWSHANSVGTLLAASGTDGIAGVGLAWRNPVMYFNTGPFFTPSEAGVNPFSSIAFVTAAISLAVEAGARVVNASVGVNCESVDTTESCQNKRASTRAHFIRPLMRANQANSLVVFAAGNDGFKHDDVLLPSESVGSEYLFRSNALIVGGTDELDHPACKVDYFSEFNLLNALDQAQCRVYRELTHLCTCPNCAGSFGHHLTTEGSAVEIAAPAYRISIPQSDGSVRVSPDSSGTSFAAPMVAGTAALVWGLNPSLRANQVRQILLDTARRGGCRQIGRGILDAAAAVRRARNFAANRNGVLTRSYYRAFFTSDGKIVGFTAGGDSPTSIIKTNPDGSIIWSYSVGQNRFISDMIETRNGDIIASSVSRVSNPSFSLHRIRSDGQGITLDTRGFGAYSSDTYARMVFRENDGLLVVAGGPFLSDSNPNQNILAFDSSINLAWTRSIESFYPKQIYLSENGGFLVTGSNNSSPQVVLIDQNGRLISRRSFTTTQNVPTNSTSLGSAVALLYPNTSAPFNSMNIRILTNTGADISNASFALNPNTRFFNVRTSSDNNLLIFGSVDLGNNGSDLFFMKVRPDGSLIFSNVYSLPDSELPKEIFETSEGYYFSFYYGNQNPSGPQPALLRIDLNGNLIR